MKEKTKRNKGITLIALILTIIVLLILAVVAINAVKGDGIIAHAKNAKADYSRAQTNEQDTLSGYELMLAEETGNAWKQEKTKVTKGNTTLNVGDTITNFTAGSKTWKVLGAEHGKLLLTTEEYVVGTSLDLNWDETENRFVEAENAWDAECAKILTDEEKVQVTEIRSIKVEDINRVTGYDPKTAENGKPFGAGEIYQYGNEVTYSVVKNESGTRVKYESKNVANKSGISTNHTQFYAQNTTENITSPYTVTSTYYEYDVDSDTNLDQSSSAYQMLFDGEGYWLTSSYVRTEEGIAIYGLYSFSKTEGISGNDLGYSATGHCNNLENMGFRPVVSLASDFQPAK